MNECRNVQMLRSTEADEIEGRMLYASAECAED